MEMSEKGNCRRQIKKLQNHGLLKMYSLEVWYKPLPFPLFQFFKGKEQRETPKPNRKEIKHSFLHKYTIEFCKSPTET